MLSCLLASLGAAADPGSALRLAGTGDYVSVAHAPALDAFPLTVTAWVQTLRNTNQADGIVSKYQDASGNGYSLLLYNGNVYGFYVRPGGNQVFVAPLGLNGGFIADGRWHHVAFTVSALGGQIYVDGNLMQTLGWSGTAGPPTSVEPLQIGRYHTYPNTFQGAIDEVTLWNRALPASEINYLKHRRLGGREEGLLGYWRFDEASGETVGNTATNAFAGALTNGAGWVESQAAVALEPVAGQCLKFDGVNGSVQVAHAGDLNAYPLTATAWFRTTNAANVVQGVVSKYADASGNGWTLVVQNGRLRGFYYRTLSNVALDVTSVAVVADGVWHHAALVVDAAGGRLLLDGTVVGSGSWVGPAGAPTGTEPLQIGRYFSYPNRFAGAIDEVTVWNRALATSEIQAMKNLPLAGNETGLVAYWRLDEGTGVTLGDATGLGHTGTLVGTALWIGSTAFLGDGSVHSIASLGLPSFTRQFAVTAAPAYRGFLLSARALLRRFYDFGPAPPAVTAQTWLSGQLQSAGTATPIALKPNTQTNTQTLTAYNASSPQPSASSVVPLVATLSLEPDGVQLDSVNDLFEASVTLRHAENDGPMLEDGSAAIGATRLLHFNGTVFFGPVSTVITNLANSPAMVSLAAPQSLQAPLQVSPNGGHVAAYPSVVFGGGGAFTVNLGTDGTATNVNGVFSLSAPGQFFEVAGIRYQLPGATLGAAGITATRLLAWLPTGFGVTTNASQRVLLPYLTQTNIVLDGNLLPSAETLVFTAASYRVPGLFFAEETKPLLIGASQVEWRIPQGEFIIPQPDTVQFVREDDDNALAAQRLNLVEPLAGDRVSNDGYYRHASAVPGVPVTIRPDANGAARLTLEVALHENEWRPHFPYLNRALGGHVPVVGGDAPDRRRPHRCHQPPAARRACSDTLCPRLRGGGLWRLADRRAPGAQLHPGPRRTRLGPVEFHT